MPPFTHIRVFSILNILIHYMPADFGRKQIFFKTSLQTEIFVVNYIRYVSVSRILGLTAKRYSPALTWDSGA